MIITKLSKKEMVFVNPEFWFLVESQCKADSEFTLPADIQNFDEARAFNEIVLDVKLSYQERETNKMHKIK